MPKYKVMVEKENGEWGHIHTAESRDEASEWLEDYFESVESEDAAIITLVPESE